MTAHPPARHARLRQAWDGLENPVMGRESRARMRGARSYVIIGVYTLVVMAFVATAYWMQAATGSPVSLHQRVAAVGRAVWLWGCVAQAGLLPLLVPAFTCGAITLERERDLLELLLLTRQSAVRICLGKLGSGIGLALMLVLASVPVLSLSFFLGGVAPAEMLACLAVLLSTVVAAGALGLAASALLPRTVTATAVVYLAVGFSLVGIPVMGAFLNAANQLSTRGSEWGILAMLGAFMLVALPPAFGITVALYVARRRKGLPPPERYWWLLTTGLAWCGLLLVLYVPGVNQLLMEGNSLMLLHPVAAVMGIMQPATLGRWSMPHLWLLAVVVYLGAAMWLFYVAVLSVSRLRAA
jgi:hypothetical protein